MHKIILAASLKHLQRPVFCFFYRVINKVDTTYYSTEADFCNLLFKDIWYCEQLRCK